jgi:hypothetical protein
MKINLKAYSGNVLIFLNTLIIFLLVFENELLIPEWLQIIGRMHPMLLHFPIVLLLVSLVMEFFQFKIKEDSQSLLPKYYEQDYVLGNIARSNHGHHGYFPVSGRLL